MTRTTRPSSGKTVYHRDGTVTCWDCLSQSWQRGRPSYEVLETFPAREADRIARHTKHPHANDFSIDAAISALEAAKQD